MRPTPNFDIKKAAQVAAFFAIKSGGSVNVLKLVKLIYLADRASMAKYDMPMLDDQPVSMDHGPVDSITYDFINGVQESPNWDAFITDRADHKVGVRRRFSIGQLDQLSRADLACLEEVWAQFGSYDKWALVDYVHKYCAEWEDPKGTSNPIKFAAVFQALGKKNPAELERRLQRERQRARYLVAL